MTRDTVSKAVLMPTGPRGQRVPGRPCVTLRLAPAAGSARYAIQGGRDLALVVLTPPPAKIVIRRQRSDVGDQRELIRSALPHAIFAARPKRRLWHKAALNSIRHPISDLRYPIQNGGMKP